MTVHKTLFYSILLLVALTTVMIGFLNMDTFSLGAIFFFIFAISPYYFSFYLLQKSTENVVVIVASFLSLFVAIGGISLLIYAMYVEKDAQSAMAFVVVPVYQWGLLILGALVLYLINKKINIHKE